ncbi:hypothetical protein K8Q94_01355 [Candidatus Nomurabacteria bacterium]|nr:hypothetical protein [Candidatus Nomurabacteria bacterium]
MSPHHFFKLLKKISKTFLFSLFIFSFIVAPISPIIPILGIKIANAVPVGGLYVTVQREFDNTSLDNASVDVRCNSGTWQNIGVISSGNISINSFSFSSYLSASASCISGTYVDVRVSLDGYVTHEMDNLFLVNFDNPDTLDTWTSSSTHTANFTNSDALLFSHKITVTDSDTSNPISGASINAGPAVCVESSTPGDYLCPIGLSEDDNDAFVTVSASGYSSANTILNDRALSTNSQALESQALLVALAPSVVINSPISDTISVWNPSISWDTAVTCSYKFDTDEYSSISCGNDIPEPSTGEHTLYVKGIDGNTNQTETSVNFTYSKANTNANYRYVKWEITKRRDAVCCVQVKEFIPLYNGEVAVWPEGTTATNPGGSNNPNDSEGAMKIIDGVDSSSKWLDQNFDNDGGDPQLGNSTVVIDTGVGHSILFNGYRFKTGNDEIGRDPISWKLYGSMDGNTWTLLDDLSDQYVTIVRSNLTEDFNFHYDPNAEFLDGDGSSGNPYQINSCAQFEHINSHLSSYFILMRDLECAGEHNNIIIDPGSMYGGFQGNFDGNGHNIDVSINYEGDNAGLFSFLHNATVSKLSISGSVQNIGSGLGGLTGFSNNSIIDQVINKANITGDSHVGGIVGSLGNNSQITNSYNIGNIISNFGNVGGIAGTVSLSSVVNSYSRGTVFSEQTNTGGLVGVIQSGAVIQNSFSVASVNSGSYHGAIFGINQTSDSVGSMLSNVFWDTLRSTQSACGNTNSGDPYLGDLATCENKNSIGSEMDYFKNTSSVFPFLGHWDFSSEPIWDSASNEYPTLHNVLNDEGPVNDRPVIHISSCSDFENINNLLDESFVLDGNLSCAGEGNSMMINSGVFSGSLDGNGYTITINLDGEGDPNIGLFSELSDTANIQDLHLAGNVQSINGSTIGALAAIANGATITDVYSSVDVSAGSGNNIGGLVGVAYGTTISGGEFNGTINGNSNIGGVAGYASNVTISDVTFSGIVNGSYCTGGVVGYLSTDIESNILNSNVSGDVNADGSQVGGLIGYSDVYDAGNLDVHGNTITGDVTLSSSSYYLGGLIGFVEGYSTGNGNINIEIFSNTIENGLIDGSNGAFSVGGLLGEIDVYDDSGSGVIVTTIHDNESNDDILGGSQYTGGLIGYSYVNNNSNNDTTNFYILNNNVTGDISGDSYIGGIAGEIDAEIFGNNNLDFQFNNNSYTAGSVTGTSNSVGGLVGYYYLFDNSSYDLTNQFKYNYSNGVISGNSNTGGLIGFLDTTGSHVDIDFRENFFGGENSSVNSTGLAQNMFDGFFAGGLVGFSNTNDTPFTIIDSYVNTNISGWAIVGGLVGYNYPEISVVNSYSKVNLNGTGFSSSGTAGGLIGYEGEGFGPGTGIINIQNSFASVQFSNFGAGYIGNIVGDYVGTLNTINTFYNDSTPEVYCSNQGPNDDCNGVNVNDNPYYFVGNNANFPLNFFDVDVWSFVAGSFPTLINVSGDDIALFDGGSGTVEDPYQISSCIQLQNINQNQSANYILTDNIDCNSDTHEGGPLYNIGYGFTPIDQFSGIFDGDGYTINDLYINNSSSNNIGLFSYVQQGAIIKNVGLENVDITGADFTGGLAGENYLGKIYNVYVNGNVHGVDVVGGVVGSNNDYSNFIVNSYSGANVTGSSNVGGFVGQNVGQIMNSYATGNVSEIGGDNFTGGFVGYNEYDGVIKNSYATGNVSSEGFFTGGFVGYYASLDILNSFSSGNVDQGLNTDYVGGFAGSGDDYLTGLDYYDQVASGHNYCVGIFGDWAPSCVSVNDIQTYYSNNSVNSPLDKWDFSSAWSTNISGYPTLRQGNLFSGTGSGTDIDPYVVTSCSQFKEINNFALLDSSFLLDADLDCADDGTQIMVGNIIPFTGHFDGNGYSINIDIDNTDGTYHDVGLFVSLNQNALIENLTVTGDILSPYNVGGIVSEINNSAIQDSSSYVNITSTANDGWNPLIGGIAGYTVSSSLSNDNYHGNISVADSVWSVGGLVGYEDEDTTISDGSYSEGDISILSGANVGYAVGGLVGWATYAIIEDSYSNTNISSLSYSNNTGGLVGQSENSSIYRTYATGDIYSIGAYVGGLMGDVIDSEVYDSYSTGTVSCNDVCGGLIGVVANSNVFNSYSSSTIVGISSSFNSHISSFIGQALNASHIEGNFSVGSVTFWNGNEITNTPGVNDTYIGGIVGQENSNLGLNEIINNSYDQINTGVNQCIGDNTPGGQNGSSNSDCNPVNTIETPNENYFKNDNSNAPLNSFNNTNWVFTENYYPTLANLSSDDPNVYYTQGDGSPENPYQINSCTGLQNVNNDLNASYILTQNIDCSDTINWNSGQGFEPLGNDDYLFNGNFNGAGYKIINLFININSSLGVGLFGETNSSAVIENLGVENENITNASSYTGGLVGYNEGTIRNVYTTGRVTSEGTYTGGLVGVNDGLTTIDKSFSNVTVVGAVASGGLIGENHGTISDSYATGSVSGGQYVGGLTGINFYIISSSYATGSVFGNGSTHGGGLTGYLNGEITDSFAVGRVSNFSSLSGGLIGEYVNGALINNFYDQIRTEQSGCSQGSDISGCSAVNTIGNPDTNYFKNNNTNEPLASWDFNDTNIWDTSTSYPLLHGNTISGISFVNPTPENNSSQSSSVAEINMDSSSIGANHYAFTDIDNSLVAFWRFENNANDDTSSSNGIWHGTETYSTGKFGKAANFNGNSYISTTLPSTITGDFTFSSWVYLNNRYAGQSIFSDENGHLIQIGGGGQWQFDEYATFAPADIGAWTHLVAVENNGTETLYVNGEIAASGGASRNIGQTINIGRRTDGVYINGKMDDTLLFSRALNSNEIASLYNAHINQYDYTNEDFSNGSHSFTGYAVNTSGVKSSTEERSFTKASDFDGGDGSEGDPYQISSCPQLQLMNNDLSAHYILVDNIDCSDTLSWNANASEWVDGIVDGELIPDSYSEVTHTDIIVENNGYYGFEPVGNDSTPFLGTFDGDGYTINNLWIFRKDSDNNGVFGKTQNANIHDVNIENSNIVGAQNTGGLVGYMYGGTITDVNLTNNMIRTYLDYHGGGLVGMMEEGASINHIINNNGVVHGSGDIIGGLVGELDSASISNSSSSADVDGGASIGGVVGSANNGEITNTYASGGTVTSNRSEYLLMKTGYAAGGFVGYLYGSNISDSYSTENVNSTGDAAGGFAGVVNYSNLMNDYATGNVTGNQETNEYNTYNPNYVGGFVGAMYSGSNITMSYATGDVTTTGSYVGGFVGNLDGYSVVDNSFSLGSVNGDDYVGGFTGSISNLSLINKVYSKGLVTGNNTENTGGLVGYNSETGNIYNSFWDNENSNQSTSAGGTGEDTSTMKTESTFTDAGWNFDTLWDIDGFTNDGYPFISESASIFNGSGNESDPYQISSCSEFTSMNNSTNSSYILMNDLDCTSLGNGVVIGINREFSGNFDGNGHTITVDINAPSESNAGLFSVVGNGSKIQHLTVNGSVVGQNVVGMVVGANYGQILDVHSSGNVSGDSNVGGLVGFLYSYYVDASDSSANVSAISSNAGGLVGVNSGDISNSHATGDVSVSNTNSSHAGGLVGVNSGDISNSYATGDVTMGANSGYAGGLVGEIDSGDISNSYATGNVNIVDGSNIGGFAGHVQDASIEQSYSTGDVDGNGDGSNQLSYNVGGFVGSTYNATISNVYSKGNVSGNTNVGGLIGQLESNVNLNNAYSIGLVIGVEDYGGLIGLQTNINNTVTNSFWDLNTSNQINGNDGTSKTDAEMKNVDTFTNIESSGISNVWDFINNPVDDENNNDIWDISSMKNQGYPFFVWQSNIPIVETLVPSNTSDNSVNLNAQIVEAGNLEISERGFEWGLTDSYGESWSESSGPYSESIFSKTIYSLSANQTYHYRAFIVNNDGTTFGEDRTFIATNAKWQDVGDQDNFNNYEYNQSLKLNSQNVAYVAYVDSSNGYGVSVKKNNGSDWELVGEPNFSGTQVDYLSMQMYQDIPYVFYVEVNNEYKITVKRFVNDTWENVGDPRFNTGYAYELSSAISANGTPFVAFEDSNYGYKGTVMSFDGNNWNIIGNAGFTDGQIYRNQIATDSNNIPYIIYSDSSHSYSATVKKLVNGDWSTLGNPYFTSNYAWHVSMVLDSNNIPYVTYSDCNQNCSISVMTLDNDTWVNVGDPEFSGTGGVSYNKILVDSNNVIYVGFEDCSNACAATVMKWNGESWIYVGNAGFSTGSIEHFSLALDSNNIPYVAYHDNSLQNKTIVKFLPVISYEYYESDETHGAVSPSNPGTLVSYNGYLKTLTEDQRYLVTDISQSDSGYDSQIFKIHQNLNEINTPTFTINWKGHGAVPDEKNVIVSIWNFNTSEWEQISTEHCAEDCDISGSKTGSDYYDNNDNVWIWVKAENSVSTDLELSLTNTQTLPISWITNNESTTELAYDTISHLNDGWDSYASHTTDDNLVTSHETSPSLIDTTEKSWREVASSYDGQRLFGVVNGGDIWASNNSGLTWNNISASLGVKNWRSVSSNSNGTIIFATVDSGNIYRGVTNNGGATWVWTNLSSVSTDYPGTQDWLKVVSSADGYSISAIIDDYSYIYTAQSNDSGLTWIWTENTSTGLQNWRSIAMDYTGDKIFAVSSYDVENNANGSVWSGVNDGGWTWTDLSQISTGYPNNMSWGDSYISTNENGSKFVVAKEGGYIYTVKSGETWDWTENQDLGTPYWYSVNMSPDGSKIILGENCGQIGVGIYNSQSGIWSWSRKGPNQCFGIGAASNYNGSKLIMSVGSGALWTSNDGGENWLNVTGNAYYYRVRSCDAEGVCKTSPEQTILYGISSSCPFIFTWNGEEYKFIIDASSSGTMGQGLDREQWKSTPFYKAPTYPNPESFVKIPSGYMAPTTNNNGTYYDIKTTFELNEVNYYDQANLEVIDHSSNVNIFPDARQNKQIHTIAKNAQAPIWIKDQNGKDVKSLIAYDDNNYYHTRKEDTSSYLTMKLSNDTVTPANLKIVVKKGKEGLFQGNKQSDALQYKNSSGVFVNVPENMNPSIGKRSGQSVTNRILSNSYGVDTKVIDLSGLTIKDNEIRFVMTNRQIQTDIDWIAVDTSPDEEISKSVLSPYYANLHFRGISNMIPLNANDAHMGDLEIPDYADLISKKGKGNTLTGMATKYGDVKDLLANVDNKFVITTQGDEISLRYEVPVQANGTERDFIYDTWDYHKSFHNALGDTIFPLPFNEMTNYPYHENLEHYPTDTEHNAYQAEYNTREINWGTDESVATPGIHHSLNTDFVNVSVSDSNDSVENPIVTTSSASSVSRSQGTLNGTIVSTGGELASVRGFYWGSTTNYGNTILQNIGSYDEGSFSTVISNLSCGTTYHFKAYAINSSGTGVSDTDRVFSTSACLVASGGGGGGGGYGGYSSTQDTTQKDVKNLEEKINNISSDFKIIKTGLPDGFQFKKNLKQSNTNNDVKLLQIFLNNNGFTIALNGVGSKGKENNFFGKKTKQQLIKFQEAHAKEILIPQGLKKGTGVLGPYTRKILNAWLMANN